MDAKEILKKIKAVFDTSLAAPPAPAPAPAAPPAKASANFPVDGGQPVYVDTSDDGLADIDVGDPVYSDEALTTPYPDGTYTVTGYTFSFTVAGGMVTACDGALAGPAAPAPPMAATPPPVMPAGPTIPQFEAMQAEVTALKAALLNARLLAEKHEKILPDIFALAEELIKMPTAEPKALNDRQKEKFEKIKERDDRIAQMAANLKKIQNA